MIEVQSDAIALPSRSRAIERMRLHRERRKKGLRWLLRRVS